MSTPKRTAQALNSSEQLALMRQPNPKAPTGLRNLCIIRLMLKAGLRVSEVLELTEEDINWQEGKIQIRGSRAAKSRTLWLADEDLALLKRWQEIKPASGKNFMFTTLEGNKLNDRYLREMIKRLSRKAGIQKDVHPHMLRYTFAANLMRDTKNFRLLQKALGHRDQSATQMYINLLFNELNEGCSEKYGIVRSGMPVDEEGPDYESEYQPVKDNNAVIKLSAFKENGPGRVPQEANNSELNWNYMEPGRREGAITDDRDRKYKYEDQDNMLHDQNSMPRVHSGDKINGSNNIDQRYEQQNFDLNGYDRADKNGWGPGNINKKHKLNQEDEDKKKKQESPGEPNIDITDKKKPIPPMKCCKCNYILSYQDDCPKCGTPFNEVMKHWRKNLW